MHLLVSDGEVVKVGDVLYFNNIRTTSVLTLANGSISFKNLIYHLNLRKESNVDTSRSIVNNNPTVIKNKISLVCLDVEDRKACTISLLITTTSF